jgi:hypothetical protein
VPGIAGSVDLNQLNGSIDDLHAYLTRMTGGGVVNLATEAILGANAVHAGLAGRTEKTFQSS